LTLLVTLGLHQPLLGADIVDRIVAIVNDDIITLYDLNRALQPYADNIDQLGYSAEQKRSALFKFRQKLLTELISRKLTEQEVKRYKISVGEEEIDNYIERLKETKYLTDEDLRKNLIEQGLTMETYREEIKRQIQRTRLVNREVKSKVVITREDIEAYYKTHKDLYGGERQYHLWNLYIRFARGTGAAEQQAARTRLEGIASELGQGVAFEDLVGKVNSSGGAVRGSDLGLFKLDELSPQLQDAIDGMQASQYSDILEIERGYQIVYLQEIVESPAKPLSAVEAEIQETLYREIVDNKFKVWLEDLRERSHIKIIN
jgi:peptidyl-prolyl cis-trans isomerase SurA